MFSKLLNKFSTFADHHQTLIALVIAFALITVTWGTEKLLDHWLSKHEVYGFLIAVIIGLFILWITKHYILHVV